MKTQIKKYGLVFTFMLICICAFNQVTIKRIINQNGAICNASVRININGGVIFPVKVVLINGIDTIDSRYILHSQDVYFANLCNGNYLIKLFNSFNCIKEVPFQVNDCNVDEISFQVVARNDVTTQNASDGLLEVKISPIGNYKYLWSNGQATEKIQNLTQGIYTLTITDTLTGCTYSKSFSINSCTVVLNSNNPPFYVSVQTKDSFDIDIKGGWAQQNGGPSFCYLYLKGKSNSSFTLYTAGSFEVVWYVNDTIAGYNVPFIEFTKAANTRVKVVVSNGCFLKTKSIDPIICNDSDQDRLFNYFVKKIVIPCQGMANGTVTFNTFDLKNNTSSLTIDGLPINVVSKDETTVGSLKQGIHKIKILFENDCGEEFDLDIPAEDIFSFNVGFANHRCIYTRYCKNIQIAVDSVLPRLVPNYDECKVDEYCGNLFKATISGERRTMRGYEYRELIGNSSIIKDDAWQTQLIRWYADDKRSNPNWGCRVLSVCLANFRARISLDLIDLLGSSITPVGVYKGIQGGCSIYDCSPSIGSVSPVIKICNSCDFSLPRWISCSVPDYQPGTSNQSGSVGSSGGSPSPCFPESSSLLQLVYKYKAGGYANLAEFKNSELEQVLRYYDEVVNVTTDNTESHIMAACYDLDFCQTTFKVLSKDWKNPPKNYSTTASCLTTYTSNNRIIHHPTCNDFERIIVEGDPNALQPNTVDKIVFYPGQANNISLDYKIKYFKKNYPKPILNLVDGTKVIMDYNLSDLRHIFSVANTNLLQLIESWDTLQSLAVYKNAASDYSLIFNNNSISKTVSLKNSTFSSNSSATYTLLRVLEFNDTMVVLGKISGDILYFSNSLVFSKYDKSGNLISKSDARGPQFNSGVPIDYPVRLYNHPGYGILYSYFDGTNYILKLFDRNLNNLASINNGTTNIISATVDSLNTTITVLSGDLGYPIQTGFSYTIRNYKKSGTTWNLSGSKTLTPYYAISDYGEAQLFNYRNNSIVLVHKLKNTITVPTATTPFNTTLAGKNDVAVLIFDKNLLFKNAVLNSSPQNEDLSNAVLYDNILYYSGFMEGGETRTIGRHTFYNATKLTRVPFMTFVDINNPVSAIQASNSSLKADNPLFKDQMVYETKNVSSKISIRPNPFAEEFDVSFFSNDVLNLEIINLVGTKVYKRQFDVNGISNYRISTRDWQNGIYFIRLLSKSGELITTQKIMKLN